MVSPAAVTVRPSAVPETCAVSSSSTIVSSTGVNGSVAEPLIRPAGMTTVVVA